MVADPDTIPATDRGGFLGRKKTGSCPRCRLLKQLDVFEVTHSLLISVEDAECYVLAVRDFSLDDRNLTPYGPIISV